MERQCNFSDKELHDTFDIEILKYMKYFNLIFG